MITLADVRRAVRTFETTSLPPMCTAWDKLRSEAVVATRLYAKQNGLTIAQVVEMVK